MSGPANALLENLGLCIQYEADNPDRSFLTREALTHFYEQGAENINLLWEPEGPVQRNHIRSHLARITCILLTIKFRNGKYPKTLRKLISTPLNSHDTITDACLPLSLQQCDVWGRTYAREFFEKQYTLLEPIYIDCNSSTVIEYPRNRCLPYIDRRKTIGKGAFGDVIQVKILKHYCGHDDYSNDKDKPVAVKILHGKNKKAWVRENRNNAYLKGNILNHKNVLVHLAAIIHHDTFYIFMDLAYHGDLETLLSGGTRRDTHSVEQRHYDFSKTFPNATRYHVFQALHDLTQALDFLHHHVENPDDRQKLKLVHNDFRPQNILIFREEGQPIGRWKIADFGISTPKRSSLLGSTSSSTSRSRLVIGDLLNSPSTHAHERSMDCPHHAPEVSSTFYRRDQQADIWSLGTVFTEVLAFTQGFDLDDLDRPGEWSRHDSEVDTLRHICGRSFYSSTKSQNIESFSLKSSVRDWLREFSKVDEHHKEYVGIIYLMLRPVPEQREDTTVVVKQLNRVLNHMLYKTSYTPPVDLAREENRLEPWRPVPRQPQTTYWESLIAVSEDNRSERLEKDHHTIEITGSTVLLRAHRRHLVDSEVLCIRPIETELPASFPKNFQLPNHVHWKTLEVSGVYGCTIGPHGECLHFSLETHRISPPHESIAEETPPKQIMPARNGIIAFCYDQSIKLRAFFHNFQELVSSLDPPLGGGKFRSIAFNDVGDKLFARISYPEKPRQDILAIWKLTPGHAPSLLTCFKVERPVQKVTRDDFYGILPWGDQIGGLMVYQNVHRGFLFTAWTATGTNRTQEDPRAYHQKEISRPYPDRTSAAITNEYLLLVDVEKKVCLYKLQVDNNRVLCLEFLGCEGLPVKKASWFVIRRNGEGFAGIGLQLVLRDKDRDCIYDVKSNPSDKKRGWKLVRAD